VTQQIVIPSNNPGKLRELQAMLRPLGVDAVPQSHWSVPEAEEPRGTFLENALAKARHAARATGLPALADDSGLCVDALDGAPGIYSARWAGPDKDFRFAMRRIEELLIAKGTPDRRAHFVCALALAAPGEATALYEGRVFGTLTFPPRGGKGFGYDPIFVPEGYRFTFGEMDPKEKHAMSHRARAFAKFVAQAIAPDTEQ